MAASENQTIEKVEKATTLLFWYLKDDSNFFIYEL